MLTDANKKNILMEYGKVIELLSRRNVISANIIQLIHERDVIMESCSGYSEHEIHLRLIDLSNKIKTLEEEIENIRTFLSS